MTNKFIPQGFLLNGISCGIKKENSLDLGMIFSSAPCKYSGVFTNNNLKAPPVKLCKERMDSAIHGLVVNSGNANSFTGEQGYIDALKMAQIAERNLNLAKDSFLSLSTGVIGEYLPMEKIEKGIQEISTKIKSNELDYSNFARSIHTTDTKTKEESIEILIDNKKVRIYGTAKGAGMIFPNMATMLAFIITDANISKSLLDSALKDAVDGSFNSISVDGDQSTNDSVILLANGQAENVEITENNKNYIIFVDALKELSLKLAHSIVRDGEGATKFIEIHVIGAESQNDAWLCANHIANSLLVKTAFFGEDANWGRFVYAIGASGCRVFEDKLDLKLGTIPLIEKGKKAKFTEDQTSDYMKNKDLYLEVNLNLGKFSKSVYTCDLSYDYVKINGDYRT